LAARRREVLLLTLWWMVWQALVTKLEAHNELSGVGVPYPPFSGGAARNQLTPTHCSSTRLTRIEVAAWRWWASLVSRHFGFFSIIFRWLRVRGTVRVASSHSQQQQ
jgi:hypothetical protein